MNRNYIAGAWVAGESEIENRNPSDLSGVIGHIAQASAAYLDAALSGAREARRAWAASPPGRKQAMLMALRVVNDTNFGLTPGIVTRDLARASHFRRNARAGVVTVNLPTAGTDYQLPFGGRGDSSHGPCEPGRSAAGFCTIVKTAHVSAGEPG